VRGVIEEETEGAEGDEAIAALDRALSVTLGEVLKALGAARAAERAAAQIGTLRARFDSQLTELLERVPSLSEERFAQEVALLVGKADVREELDRLAAHIAQARTLLAEARPDNPVGRKFDFLCQEFNREANTLCSKSADIELTRIGIDLKGAVERMREQVQNVE